MSPNYQNTEYGAIRKYEPEWPIYEPSLPTGNIHIRTEDAKST